MGTWGVYAFENDDASDWVYELETSADASIVRQALEVRDAEYLELSDGHVAIAAAEVVAAALGYGGPPIPPEVEEWLSQYGQLLTREDAIAAITATDRVRMGRSELREMWNEADARAWTSGMDDLRRRLLAAAQ
jgi:hypothetical protein